MVFLTENWFWRGTQSAIFYYASCTPWVEYKYKRRRRQAAEKSQKEKADNVIYMQPGVIKQPAPFQTNEEWADEIVQGPGPPKGWKRDPLWYKHAKNRNRECHGNVSTRPRAETGMTTSSLARSDRTMLDSPSTPTIPLFPPPTLRNDEATKKSSSELRKARDRLMDYEGSPDRDLSPGMSSTVVDSRPSASPDNFRKLNSSSTMETDTTGSKRSSFVSSNASERRQSAPRPSMEKRLSSAMDGFKDTMRAALHPEQWNWIRYDRDDEILSNLNERMKSVWEGMKVHINLPGEALTSEMKQVTTVDSVADSDVKMWQRGTHPAVNDLHPPIVSQLPYTREDARWMLMPPPSADVMMGRRRPDPFDDLKRQPLCIIGRPPREKEPPPVTGLPPVDSDEDFEGSADEEPGWTHVQKPQRPHLWKHRLASMP